MRMTPPFLDLQTLLGVIHLGTSILILDISTDTYIEDVDEYDGYDDFGDYKVVGIRITKDHRMMILVEP